jgi:SPP1 family predicted phage head-tail adaptor
MSALDPGQLDCRLILEAPVETPDGAGGVTRTYQFAASLWAAVTPLASAETVAAAADGATAVYRVVVRRRAGITTAHRLRWGDRILRIAALRDADTRRRFLELRAEQWLA